MFIQNILAKLADGEADTPQLFSAVYTKRYIMKKVASRCPLDASPKEQGRSMVEMLGVLAIIGVLSVGAIAGYSKAMFKYKLNKQAEQLNQVVNSVIKYVRVMDSYKSAQNLTPLFVKLGEIPQEMIKPNIQNYFYDIFNNQMYIYNEVDNSNNKNWHALVMYVNLPLLSNSNNSLEICRNVLTVAKENSANLKWVVAYNNDETSHFGWLAGDNYCKASFRCLRNLTLNDIDNLCNNKVSILYILWHYPTNCATRAQPMLSCRC